MPCAAGEPGGNGKRCPYRETAPLSLEGWQAWDVVTKCAGQLRLSPTGGVSGLDLSAAFTCAHALGYDLGALAELLPAAEAGMVAAFNGRTPNTSD